jgi:hypothetical protein
MQDYDPEYPPGYLEADEKYNRDDYDFESDNIMNIWGQLDIWREHEKGYPELIAQGFGPDTSGYKKSSEINAELIEKFKARIIKAVFDGDRVYLENLLKAIDHKSRPQLEMNGIRAAIRAFEELFIQLGLESKDDWPSKQEVRQRAEEILRKAGRALPTERHWPRIFRQAGLWDLPSVTYGRARKRKKN